LIEKLNGFVGCRFSEPVETIQLFNQRPRFAVIGIIALVRNKR